MSDLGDDPAIPDPHGIRKPKTAKNNHSETLGIHTNQPKLDALQSLHLTPQLKKISGLVAGFAFLAVLGLVFFGAYESLKSNSQAQIESAQNQLTELQKEVAVLRNELQDGLDDIYKEIESLEVSIHSFKEKKAENKVIYKPPPIPHEAELRRWRYLGSLQMGHSQRAYFHTGKGGSTFEMGASVLGDWRLSHIQKDVVTLTHPQGKSLALTASKSE
ncbi:DUF948 domain-containing protein [Polynucleobacter sp. AP-Kolm-20A-A1]|uniref:DUF948 domain-containing protein n=1 Tax=Polynucleobacter sp. AP-Kolm-20A-A1 TaxID=2081041 RepID=UPI001BFD4775|nr:DUF948 domain-containing protein [Polynucleobacter sp. AP-Kolm-20A-A1]QWE20708.1 hypothetical protein C2745_00495 [Polynucleobacter sp. AP-Kolm-20A-A1]